MSKMLKMENDIQTLIKPLIYDTKRGKLDIKQQIQGEMIQHSGNTI